MTILALDRSVSSEVKHGNNDCACPLSLVSVLSVIKKAPSCSPHRPVPRINLKKRNSSEKDRAQMNLATVNSAFLDGLFADVAIAQNDEENIDQPTKKTRISKTKSLSRCGKSFKSFKILEEAYCSESCSSPVSVTTKAEFVNRVPTSPQNTPKEIPTSDDIKKREESLHFQLSQVSDSNTAVLNAASHIAFPHLPATVSHDTLTRVQSDLQSSLAEIHADHYGWFVEMDDQEPTAPAVIDAYGSSNDLAFVAPTAPKADKNHDDEVLHAQAADTIDDVLGDVDFF
jgi:hypothetical protein